MKVSQNWLKELVVINSSPAELSEKLSIGGFEVESLCVKGAELVIFCDKSECFPKLEPCS